MVYALLNRITENVYIGLWQYVQNNLPEDIFDWQNVSIVSDFETAMRNAIQILADALRNISYGRYDTMAYLRRVSYSVRGYINMQIGPLANGRYHINSIGCIN